MPEHANVLHFLSRFIDKNANLAPQKKSAVFSTAEIHSNSPGGANSGLINTYISQNKVEYKLCTAAA